MLMMDCAERQICGGGCCDDMECVVEECKARRYWILSLVFLLGLSSLVAFGILYRRDVYPYTRYNMKIHSADEDLLPCNGPQYCYYGYAVAQYESNEDEIRICKVYVSSKYTSRDDIRNWVLFQYPLNSHRDLYTKGDGFCKVDIDDYTIWLVLGVLLVFMSLFGWMCDCYRKHKENQSNINGLRNRHLNTFAARSRR